MKKALSLVLSVLLALGVLPLTALPARAAVVKSGTCGSNLTWTLDDAGTLTISGSGTMNNWNVSPWYNNTAIHTVVIQNGVTSIGESTFEGCAGLTSVTIPDSVTSIGHDAFYDCTGLTSVTIPDSVTSIEDYTFCGCTGLTSVTIPNSVTSIGWYAFCGCTGLTSVTIPDSVTSIGGLAFSGCEGLTSVTIPDSVTSIGYGAFHLTAWYNNQPDGLIYAGKVAYKYKGAMPENTAIVLKDGTKGIAEQAFFECKGLTSVTIPGSVMCIGSQNSCGGDYLYSIFYGCTGLISVTIENGVTRIGEVAFEGCTGLTTVTIPDSVTSIGGGAFMDCTGLTSVTIGNGVTRIDEYAFDDCWRLKDVYYSGSKTQWETIDIEWGNDALKEATIHYQICSHSPSAAVKENIVEPTCTQNGSYASVVYCERCGAELSRQTVSVEATGHDYGAWTKLDDTQHQRVCANDKTHIETADHTWDGGVITTAATCTEDGVKTYTCTVCNATKTETIPATGHSYGEWTKLDDAQHQRVCANDPSHVETENHAWDDGTVTTKPTDKAEGVKTYTCTVCGAERTEAIRIIGDADGDGKVTSADARLALRASVRLKEKDDVTEGSAGYLACDVDHDGEVTPTDARLILRASVGLEKLK